MTTTSARLGTVHLWELLRAARERNASDLHLGAGEPPALRIDGALVRLESPPLRDDDLNHFAGELLDEQALQVLYERGDADGARRDDELGTFRIHAFRAFGHLRFAIRLLARQIPNLERLGLPPILASFAERTAGLVLFVGPTGSGKTTSLAALIDLINRTSDRHIVTVEDPLEYAHRPIRSLISHRELGPDVRDYATAVRSCLRADPDVILIGELRDTATMSAALIAAETGHLVFSTLHTGDAAQTVDRIVDAFGVGSQGEVRVQLAQTLVGVVSQRLLPRASGHGRRAAAEILVATDAVRALIRDGKSHQLRNAIQTGRTSGMQTLETHLSELVVRRDVTLEAARAATDRASEIRTLAGAM
ncbi:MAG TPA: PilT/PilU family type 4a pilus ATPase [Candidatus Acidoferrales bacterium]|nr:PilT/PilU family type 4a pilus ATPase [Candidatus Acidoferrales bacterium]